MPIIFISLFKTHLYLANSESREYENVENTIDVQPEVIFYLAYNNTSFSNNNG